PGEARQRAHAAREARRSLPRRHAAAAGARMSLAAPHLERYLKLLKSLSPKVEGLMFVDAEGTLHCARDGTPGGRGAEKALARLQAHAWQPVNGCLYRTWHGGMALARELAADNGQRVGTLIVRIRG